MGAMRWNWTVDSSKIQKDGLAHEENKKFVNCMVKGDSYYDIGPYYPDKMSRPYLARIRPYEEKFIKIYAYDFHPMFYFGIVDRDMCKRLDQLYREGDLPGDMEPIRVDRDGDLVTCQLRDEEPINRYVFNLAQGCNLVSWYSKASIVTERWDFEYEEINGVFVPKSAKWHNEQRVEGHEPKILKRVVDFEGSVVNEPIPVSEFSLDKLGVEPGDTIYDVAIGLSYTYKTETVDALISETDSIKKTPIGAAENNPNDLMQLNEREAANNKGGNGAPTAKTTEPERMVGHQEARRTFLLWSICTLIVGIALGFAGTSWYFRRKGVMRKASNDQI